MILSYFKGGFSLKDTAYEEKCRHSSLYIPYTYYKCVIPNFYPCVPLHFHSEFEINYIREGRGLFSCGGHSFEAAVGDIVIVLPDKLHSIFSENGEKLIYDTVVFNRSMLCGSSEDRCYAECLSPLFAENTALDLPVTKKNSHYPQIREAMENIMSFAKENSGEGDLMLKSELMKLFWLIIKSGAVSCDMEPKPYDKNILKAQEYIRNSYSSELTVKKLADTVHLSESYFMGKFKEVTGMSVMEYVSMTRIRAACELLANTDLSSSETAFEVGFGNLSNFNRQFRKAVGYSPREYRKAMGAHCTLK